MRSSPSISRIKLKFSLSSSQYSLAAFDCVVCLLTRVFGSIYLRKMRVGGAY